ncbi:MAG TPA: hypothetical protein VFE77_06455 [Rhodanobacter sp.]|nr:hypothetical protein [Rhodanobacter sp.]
MISILQRILTAYRPLYLHGLLLDGQYRLPMADQPTGPAISANRSRRRSLLAALTGLSHHLFHHRSKS